MKKPEMEDLWHTIRTRVDAISPEYTLNLAGPASEQDLLELQQHLPMPLPAAFLASLRIHDGESGQVGVFLDFHLMSCQEILEWHRWEQGPQARSVVPDEYLEDNPEAWAEYGWTPEQRVKPKSCNSLWVPFAHSNADMFLYLDFDPTSKGISGQVILVWPECWVYAVVADSYLELFSTYAQHLENGTVVVGEAGWLEDAAFEALYLDETVG